MRRNIIKNITKVSIAFSILAGIGKIYKIDEKLKYIVNIPEDDKVIVIEGKGSQNSFSENTINLIVWNSYKAKKKGFFNDLNILVKNNDLILLQEYCLTKDLLENLLPNPEVEIITAISFYTKKEIPTGVCTISKVENTKIEYLRSEHREPILKTPKMALVTFYKANGKELCVINVHGINFVSKSKYEKQLRQIEEIIKNYEGPMILGGDFNVWNKRRELILHTIARNYGFEEIEFINDSRRIKLDRIFVKGINMESAERLIQFRSSDHKPLSIKFKL